MFDDDDEFEDGTEELSGSALIASLRKQLKAASKTIKEKDAAIAELSTVKHEQTVASMLESYGLNSKIAAFIPDSVEDQDDLEAWLDEYGSLFGIEAVDDEVALDEDDEAADRMNDFEEEGGVDPQYGYDTEARLKAATSEAEIMAIVRGQG